MKRGYPMHCLFRLIKCWLRQNDTVEALHGEHNAYIGVQSHVQKI